VVQITGYGRHGERWVVDRYNIRFSLRADENGESLPVNPSAYLEDWQLLRTDVLEKRWPMADNPEVSMPVQAMAIDSGGEDGVTGNAYAFWLQCQRDGLRKKLYLFKGDSLTRSKLITETFPDNTDRSNRRAQVTGNVPLYLLQTNQLKDRISNALARDVPGTNYIHIPDWLGEWFYDELTYEERQPDGKWLKPGRGNNEALDLLCYAHALAILLGYEKINWDKKLPKWLRVAQETQGEPTSLGAPVAAKKAAEKSAPDKRKTQNGQANAWPTMKSGGGWV
jgi:phage terminase large subunit GpA-like protein